MTMQQARNWFIIPSSCTDMGQRRNCALCKHQHKDGAKRSQSKSVRKNVYEIKKRPDPELTFRIRPFVWGE